MNIATIVLRLIAFPFFAAISLIGLFVLWMKFIKNFILHGGEAISYTNKMQRKRIADVYEEVQKHFTENKSTQQ